LLYRAVEGDAEVEPQLGPHELGHVGRRLPRGVLEEATGALREVDDEVRIVDEDARRRVLFERVPMPDDLWRGARAARRVWGSELRDGAGEAEARERQQLLPASALDGAEDPRFPIDQLEGARRLVGVFR
jgi:hypothetical protein